MSDFKIFRCLQIINCILEVFFFVFWVAEMLLITKFRSKHAFLACKRHFETKKQTQTWQDLMKLKI
jgi:hypothetical protein